MTTRAKRKRKPVTADKVAREFAYALSELLTDAEWAEMSRRNALPEYGRACASHDFCDANVVMEAALADHKVDRPPPGSRAEELYNKLWSDAWDLAKRRYLGGRHLGVA